MHIVDGRNLKVRCVATEVVQQRVLQVNSGNTVWATGVGFHVFSLNSHSELRQHDLVEGKNAPESTTVEVQLNKTGERAGVLNEVYDVQTAQSFSTMKKREDPCECFCLDILLFPWEELAQDVMREDVVRKD